MPTLKRITHLPETLQVLEAEASEAGFKFLHRLIEEWVIPPSKARIADVCAPHSHGQSHCENSPHDRD